MTLSLSNYLAADSAAEALRRDVRDGLDADAENVAAQMVLRLGRQRPVRPDHPAAGVLPDPRRGADPACAVGRDRRRVGCRHAGRARQRHLGEDPTAARRPARQRIAAPVHPVRRRRRRCCRRPGRRIERRVPGHRDRRGVRRLRGAPRQDPARRPPAGGLPRLDDRQPDARAARRLPGRAVRHPAARGHACCWAPTWSRTPAGWCAPTTTARA